MGGRYRDMRGRQVVRLGRGKVWGAVRKRKGEQINLVHSDPGEISNRDNTPVGRDMEEHREWLLKISPWRQCQDY